ncbi:uncharacterized protein F5891DRAFT_1192400 [Suillus fuscotomentosus]|uniref:Uncharacterized protein n=1 Tax=Suillus fuscotomentosus TaxID=1912939 RepID=A0AAD4E0I5_9AGAM|nr:uncharacterized protein F5891DRAFT_1192400 [Suillus fuscotomentosus]KAG1896986.1 hypothetical protein F5891DRAFT_1192400 [Suillus fuscotomentosus]
MANTIKSLEASDFKWNTSTDLITFSINAPPSSFPATSSSSHIFSAEGSSPTKPDIRPSVEFREGRRCRRGDGTSFTNHASSNTTSNQNDVSSSTTNDSSYEKITSLPSLALRLAQLLYSTPYLTP